MEESLVTRLLLGHYSCLPSVCDFKSGWFIFITGCGYRPQTWSGQVNNPQKEVEQTKPFQSILCHPYTNASCSRWREVFFVASSCHHLETAVRCSCSSAQSMEVASLSRLCQRKDVLMRRTIPTTKKKDSGRLRALHQAGVHLRCKRNLWQRGTESHHAGTLGMTYKNIWFSRIME